LNLLCKITNLPIKRKPNLVGLSMINFSAELYQELSYYIIFIIVVTLLFGRIVHTVHCRLAVSFAKIL
jgi:hypothetical protein